jgi:isopentenyldiphosphate isomerase
MDFYTPISICRSSVDGRRKVSEIIDIFDGNHCHIGEFERVAAHQLGLWHQTFHCWLVNGRSDTGSVVLQLRAPTKKNYPDMLDITAAGHLQAGESPVDGLRELEEELGVVVSPDRLVSLGIKHDIMDEPGGVRNREFAHVYLLRDDRQLDQYTLAEDEVSGLVEIEISEGLALFAGQKSEVSGNATRIEGRERRSFVRQVRIADLIPRVDSYYLKIFLMSQLFLEGRRYLCI